MEFTDKDIEQLENFWKGNISEADRLALENRFETDLNFRKKADELRLFTEGLKVLKEREMRKHIKDINTKLPPFDPPSSTNWLKIGIVALAIALAAFAVWFFMIREEEQPLSPMVAAYFEPYPALGITRGEDDKNIKTEALRTYAVGDFKKAIPLLHKAFDIERDSSLLFYESIALIGSGQSEQAKAILKNLKGTDALQFDSIEWYLALAYLETKDKENALNLLKKLADTDPSRFLSEGVYQTKAKELLEKVKK